METAEILRAGCKRFLICFCRCASSSRVCCQKLFCWLRSWAPCARTLLFILLYANKVMTDTASVILPITALFPQPFIGLSQWLASCRFTICMCERDKSATWSPGDAGSISNSQPGSFILYLRLLSSAADLPRPASSVSSSVSSPRSSLINVATGALSLALCPSSTRSSVSFHTHTCQLQKEKRGNTSSNTVIVSEPPPTPIMLMHLILLLTVFFKCLLLAASNSYFCCQLFYWLFFSICHNYYLCFLLFYQTCSIFQSSVTLLIMAHKVFISGILFIIQMEP